MRSVRRMRGVWSCRHRRRPTSRRLRRAVFLHAMYRVGKRERTGGREKSLTQEWVILQYWNEVRVRAEVARRGLNLGYLSWRRFLYAKISPLRERTRLWETRLWTHLFSDPVDETDTAVHVETCQEARSAYELCGEGRTLGRTGKGRPSSTNCGRA